MRPLIMFPITAPREETGVIDAAKGTSIWIALVATPLKKQDTMSKAGEGANAAETSATMPAARVAAITLRFSRRSTRGTTSMRPAAYPAIVVVGIELALASEVPNDAPISSTSGCDAKSGSTMMPTATAKSQASGRVIAVGAGTRPAFLITVLEITGVARVSVVRAVAFPCADHHWIGFISSAALAPEGVM